MKELFASSNYALVSLVLFFTLFVGILIWVLRPGSSAEFEKHANIPLKDNENDR